MRERKRKLFCMLACICEHALGKEDDHWPLLFIVWVHSSTRRYIIILRCNSSVQKGDWQECMRMDCWEVTALCCLLIYFGGTPVLRACREPLSACVATRCDKRHFCYPLESWLAKLIKAECSIFSQPLPCSGEHSRGGSLIIFLQ